MKLPLLHHNSPGQQTTQIHTWPEFGYAAIDIFSCTPEAEEGEVEEATVTAANAAATSSDNSGGADVMSAVDAIVHALTPQTWKVKILHRGVEVKK